MAGLSMNPQYNTANQRTRATLGDGTYWVYQYDSLGQVIAGKRFWGDGTPVAGQQFEYGFDNIGNRKSSGGRASAVGSYTNNLLNQVTGRGVAPYVDVLGVANPTTNVTVGIQGGTAYTAARKGEYFDYPLTVANSTAQCPTVEIKSLYGSQQTNTGKVYVPTATESFVHDADGNLTSDGRWTYTWDAENRLVQMIRDTDSPSGARQKLVFEYDHQGRRIRKQFYTYSGGWQEQTDLIFLYDGWNLVAELNANASNAKVRTAVWGSDLSGSLQGAGGVGGLLKVTYFGTATTNAFAADDGNGNVAALIDAANGSVCARYEYGAFGEPIRVTGPFARANPFRWSTKYWDQESELSYYGYRYYSPALGRWISRDPAEEEDNSNSYVCVSNNHQRWVDPSGQGKVDPKTRFLLALCSLLLSIAEHPGQPGLWEFGDDDQMDLQGLVDQIDGGGPQPPVRRIPKPFPKVSPRFTRADWVMSKIRRGARFAGRLGGPLALVYAGIQTSEAGQRMAGHAEDYARERKAGDTP